MGGVLSPRITTSPAPREYPYSQAWVSGAPWDPACGRVPEGPHLWTQERAGESRGYGPRDPIEGWGRGGEEGMKGGRGEPGHPPAKPLQLKGLTFLETIS